MTNFTNIQQPACAVSPAAGCKLAFVDPAVEVTDEKARAEVVQSLTSPLRRATQTLRRALLAIARAAPQHGPSTTAVSAACKDGIRPPMP